MSILKLKYKEVLKKLDLSINQLNDLKNRTNPESICKGPFIEGEKMCPNTTALSIKIGEKLKDKYVVRKLLNKYGITNFDLVVFYILFDLPAMVSNKFFNRSILAFRGVVQELIDEKLNI